MNKGVLAEEYILSRKWYLEAELKRCGEALDEFLQNPDIAHYRREIGVLHGRLDSYENELDALKRFTKRLEGGEE